MLRNLAVSQNDRTWAETRLMLACFTLARTLVRTALVYRWNDVEVYRKSTGRALPRK